MLVTGLQRLEYLRHFIMKLRRDSRSVITHFERHKTVIIHSADRDDAHIPVMVLDRIIDQVLQNLLQMNPCGRKGGTSPS